MKKILFFVLLLSSVITNSQTIGSGSGSSNGNVTIPDNSITDVKIAPGINKSKVGLSNADNTSDVNKPISTATQTALDLKVDKTAGERLINAIEIAKLASQSGINTGDQDLSNLLVKNTAITGGTYTKITYDAKGLVTAGVNLIASDIPILNQNTTGTASSITGTITQSQVTGLTADLNGKVDKTAGERLINAAEITKLSNQSGTNTGDQDLSNLLVKNTAISGATYTKITYDAKGLVTAGTNLVANDIPVLNQNTTGTASTITGTISQSQVTGLATDLSSKVDKATGKSLLSDTEITRLSTLVNYTHPATHPPSIIAQDANNRFVTDAEKATWNNIQSSSPSISSKTASYTLSGSDSTVLFDATASNLTVTLPPASGLTGKIFTIRKIDPTNKTLAFSPALKKDGGNVTTLNYVRTIKVQSNGTDWIIIE